SDDVGEQPVAEPPARLFEDPVGGWPDHAVGRQPTLLLELPDGVVDIDVEGVERNAGFGVIKQPQLGELDPNLGNSRTGITKAVPHGHGFCHLRLQGWSACYPAGSADEPIELPEEGGLRLGADDLLDNLPTREDLQRWDRGDPVGGRGLRILVGVELDDVELVLRGRDLLEHRSNHAAWPAPLGPEVDEDRLLALQYTLFEVGVGDVLDRAH